MNNLKTVAGKATDWGRSASETIEDVREGTGKTLSQAAASVRKGAAVVDRFASNMAERLDAARNYRRYGKKRMAGLMIAGAAIGFFAGFVLSRGSQVRS